MNHTEHEAYLELIADSNRRQAIDFLRNDAAGPVSLETLIDGIHKPPPEESRDKEAVAVEFHHVHLPKLAAHGIVAYDPEAKTVRYEPDERVEASLGAVLDSVASDD